jgi:hypothetical protein
MKQRAIRFAFDRYFRWRIGELMAPTSVAILDYPVSPEPRYGYRKPPHEGLYRILARNRASYMRRLTNFPAMSDLIGAIPGMAEFKADELGSMGSSIWLRIAQGSGSGIPAHSNEQKDWNNQGQAFIAPPGIVSRPLQGGSSQIQRGGVVNVCWNASGTVRPGLRAH